MRHRICVTCDCDSGAFRTEGEFAGRWDTACTLEVMAAIGGALDPTTDVALDVHGSCNLINALHLANKLDPLGLLWLEGPVR